MAPGSILDRPPKVRWPRSQKFELSQKGREVEQDYRERIVASRENQGRESFDSARTDWGRVYNLQPDDGLYLAEVRERPVSMVEIVEALQTCGKSKSDAIAAMERLVDGGFIATPMTSSGG